MNDTSSYSPQEVHNQPTDHKNGVMDSSSQELRFLAIATPPMNLSFSICLNRTNDLLLCD